MPGILDEQTLAGHVRAAVKISLDHVEAGGIPFAGMVVAPTGEIIGTGVNRVEVDRDPLAHAEIVAMRQACQETGQYRLNGCVLIASGEPCALCYYSSIYFGVEEIVYAVDRHGAARAGFDYTGSYRMLAVAPEHWQSPRVRELSVDDASAPFEAWQRQRRTGAGAGAGRRRP